MSLLREIFTIEILYRLSISDNITNLCEFDDDQKILNFMENIIRNCLFKIVKIKFTRMFTCECLETT